MCIPFHSIPFHSIPFYYTTNLIAQLIFGFFFNFPSLWSIVPLLRCSPSTYLPTHPQHLWFITQHLHDSGPIQWARGDVGLKPSAAVRPHTHIVPLLRSSPSTLPTHPQHPNIHPHINHTLMYIYTHVAYTYIYVYTYGYVARSCDR